MDLLLKGKVAIVGGASKGLGRACAQALAEEGVNVALCSRSQPEISGTDHGFALENSGFAPTHALGVISQP